MFSLLLVSTLGGLLPYIQAWASSLYPSTYPYPLITPEPNPNPNPTPKPTPSLSISLRLSLSLALTLTLTLTGRALLELGRPEARASHTSHP